MSEKPEKSATWHTPLIVAVLVGAILFSIAWMVLGPNGSGGADVQTPPKLLVFDPDLLMEELTQPGQFEDPITGRAEVMAAARQVAQEVADRTGAVVINKKAAIAAPASIDITRRVLEESRRRIAQAQEIQ